jgi:hypothetical protein
MLGIPIMITIQKETGLPITLQVLAHQVIKKWFTRFRVPLPASYIIRRQELAGEAIKKT